MLLCGIDVDAREKYVITTSRPLDIITSTTPLSRWLPGRWLANGKSLSNQQSEEQKGPNRKKRIAGMKEWLRYPATRANFGHLLLLSVDRTPVSGLKASCVLYQAAPNGHLSITAMRISRLTVKRRDKHDFPDFTNRQHPSGRNSTSIVFASNHRVAVRQDDRRRSLR